MINKKILAQFFSLSSVVLFSHHSAALESRYPEIGNGRVEQNLVHTQKYMVSSASPYASEVGMKILAQGGTAVDAAIAVQMVLTLVEPESSGIGGGGFALYWNNKNKNFPVMMGVKKHHLKSMKHYFKKMAKT